MDRNATTILLGHGIFYIEDKPIALTRGGGKFTVEREYRSIEADGYPGAIKGNIVIDSSQAKLEINQLTIVPEDFSNMYPGLVVEKTSDTVKITGDNSIKDSDYQDEVSWIGKTREGKAVKITVENAINLENLDWEMQDKSEVINKLTYNATYDLNDETKYEPWSIEWGIQESQD